MNATRCVALCAWLLGACGSISLEHADAAALERDAGAAEMGIDRDTVSADGAGGAPTPPAPDASPELAAERPPEPLSVCPIFHVSQDCHSASSGGGQAFAYCYVCKDAAGSPVVGCSNGPPKPMPGGNLCVASCADCAP